MAPTPLGISPAAQAAVPFLDAGFLQRRGQSDPSKTAKDFEAMFLRQTLEGILPSCESGVFGAGTAAGMWRSMLADQVSAVLAERGVLRLSGAVFATKGIAE